MEVPGAESREVADQPFLIQQASAPRPGKPPVTKVCYVRVADCSSVPPCDAIAYVQASFVLADERSGKQLLDLPYMGIQMLDADLNTGTVTIVYQRFNDGENPVQTWINLQCPVQEIVEMRCVLDFIRDYMFYMRPAPLLEYYSATGESQRHTYIINWPETVTSTNAALAELDRKSLLKDGKRVYEYTAPELLAKKTASLPSSFRTVSSPALLQPSVTTIRRPQRPVIQPPPPPRAKRAGGGGTAMLNQGAVTQSPSRPTRSPPVSPPVASPNRTDTSSKPSSHAQLGGGDNGVFVEDLCARLQSLPLSKAQPDPLTPGRKDKHPLPAVPSHSHSADSKPSPAARQHSRPPSLPIASTVDLPRFKPGDAVNQRAARRSGPKTEQSRPKPKPKTMPKPNGPPPPAPKGVHKRHSAGGVQRHLPTSPTKHEDISSPRTASVPRPDGPPPSAPKVVHKRHTVGEFPRRLPTSPTEHGELSSPPTVVKATRPQPTVFIPPSPRGHPPPLSSSVKSPSAPKAGSPLVQHLAHGVVPTSPARREPASPQSSTLQGHMTRSRLDDDHDDERHDDYEEMAAVPMETSVRSGDVLHSRADTATTSSTPTSASTNLSLFSAPDYECADTEPREDYMQLEQNVVVPGESPLANPQPPFVPTQPTSGVHSSGGKSRGFSLVLNDIDHLETLMERSGEFLPPKSRHAGSSASLPRQQPMPPTDELLGDEYELMEDWAKEKGTKGDRSSSTCEYVDEDEIVAARNHDNDGDYLYPVNERGQQAYYPPSMAKDTDADHSVSAKHLGHPGGNGNASAGNNVAECDSPHGDDWEMIYEDVVADLHVSKDASEAAVPSQPPPPPQPPSGHVPPLPENVTMVSRAAPLEHDEDSDRNDVPYEVNDLVAKEDCIALDPYHDYEESNIHYGVRDLDVTLQASRSSVGQAGNTNANTATQSGHRKKRSFKGEQGYSVVKRSDGDGKMQEEAPPPLPPPLLPPTTPSPPTLPPPTLPRPRVLPKPYKKSKSTSHAAVPFQPRQRQDQAMPSSSDVSSKTAQWNQLSSMARHDPYATMPAWQPSESGGEVPKKRQAPIPNSYSLPGRKKQIIQPAPSVPRAEPEATFCRPDMRHFQRQMPPQESPVHTDSTVKNSPTTPPSGGPVPKQNSSRTPTQAAASASNAVLHTAQILCTVQDGRTGMDTAHSLGNHGRVDAGTNSAGSHALIAEMTANVEQRKKTAPPVVRPYKASRTPTSTGGISEPHYQTVGTTRLPTNPVRPATQVTSPRHSGPRPLPASPPSSNWNHGECRAPALGDDFLREERRKARDYGGLHSTTL
ncbi:nascent polypeptide-associated complex subunit alpha, muscle-specific form-like [Sycon ciliatum]|uniref:nascent polypeptide-associated complex subunit alpha, muscle-specific form-like n=1 Tax=Sycon ciliatum TaxID=27933 RepID=UPI0031F6A5DB